MDYRISARTPDLSLTNQKKRTFQLVDFDVPADHRVMMKLEKEIR